ncbi:GTP-dependent nucleic acid-binding protein engD [Phytophthora cinnamomi]|uniref:GTP-dependent nucleic acid-binding protein engD n=1 Tax=Phytophthora cinnamomi TaxID=4785 RepID=UPI003559E769|nr:GTP-dependent nucleic acid-binding protein engD [Phytophthora cinnamomi]
MLAAPRSPRTTFTNRQVCGFYFRPCRDQYDEVIIEYYRCRRDPGETGSLVHYVRHSAQNLFGWLEWLVKCNLPLSFCESKLARRYTHPKPVSVETLRRIIEAVTRSVERAIAVEMPARFGIIFDGWSDDSEQWSQSLRATSHQAFLATMLARDYQKRPEQVLFLVGDNCGVNRRLATLMGVPLVGCASHRLNRAVAARLSECADDLDLVQALMIKLRTLHHSAKLRFKTDLRPIIRQQTRWSSTFTMLNRYFELLPFIDAEDEELAELLPPAASKRRLRDLLGELKDVESVSKALQGADANLLDVRIWFDSLIAAKPSYARYLAPRADIVHSPDFEAGCVRVLKGQAKRLTRAEKAALEPLLVSPPADEGEQEEKDEEASISFVERLQKLRRLEERQPTYELLASIPPISYVVERFF